MNKISIMGRICNDIEVRQTNSAIKVLNLNIAVKRRFSKNNDTDFFKVTFWDKKADLISQYFKKGDLILIVGRLENNKYVNKNGENRNENIIMCEEIHFCVNNNNSSENINDEDDLPF